MGSPRSAARLFVVTHRTQDAPDASTGFTFVDGFAEALAAASRGRRPGRSIAGGADVIRQALDAGGRRLPSRAGGALRRQALFEGFTRDLDLEIRSVHHSAYAVHTTYGVLEAPRALARVGCEP